MQIVSLSPGRRPLCNDDAFGPLRPFPSALREALVEFGLIGTFQALDHWKREQLLAGVEGTGGCELLVERIAAVLDEVAGYRS